MRYVMLSLKNLKYTLNLLYFKVYLFDKYILFVHILAQKILVFYLSSLDRF